MKLRLVSPESTEWERCVRVARERYFLDYGAEIDPLPEKFALLATDRGTGVAGMSGAEIGGTLMAETYLREPVECLISDRLGHRVPRTEIIEVGPLAAEGTGVGRALIETLPALCWCQGAQALVCTVTERLARMLAAVGIRLDVLADASLDRLPAAQRASWGRYYDTNPVTGYIDLSGFDAEILDAVPGTTRLSLVDAGRQARTLTTTEAGR